MFVKHVCLRPVQERAVYSSGYTCIYLIVKVGTKRPLNEGTNGRGYEIIGFPSTGYQYI